MRLDKQVYPITITIDNEEELQHLYNLLTHAIYGGEVTQKLVVSRRSEVYSLYSFIIDILGKR